MGVTSFRRVIRRGSHEAKHSHCLQGSSTVSLSSPNTNGLHPDIENPTLHRNCITAKERRADRLKSVEELWRRFFADPSQWWDNRSRKTSAKLPDFVHRISREGLWTGRYFNPAWVEEELASLERRSPFSSPIRATYKRDLFSSNGNDLPSLESLGTFKRLCDQQRLDEALQAVDKMQESGQEISSDVFYCVLHGCIKHKDLVAGRKLYCLILRGGLETNTFLGSHLIRMFASCGSLSEADEVFSRLPKHNVFAWSAAIAAHTRYGQAVQAFKLYNQMQILCIKPDEYIFTSILKVCAKLRCLDLGQLVNSSIIEGDFDWDPGVCNALIDMYMKCGSLKDAQRVFDRTLRQDAVAMTALISGYTQHGLTLEAFQVFQGMLEKGMEPDDFVISSLLKACSSGLLSVQGNLLYALVVERGFDEDAIIGSALIDMYVKCGSIRDACKAFGSMPGTNLPSWNALIAGFALQSEHGSVLNSVNDLQRQGLKPDELGLACLLSACSRMGLVGRGCNLFEWMQKEHGVTPTVEHFTCIADLLGRAGHVTRAEDLLRSMPIPSDAVGWATVLSHCRTFGNMRKGRHSFGISTTIDGAFVPSKFMYSQKPKRHGKLF